YQANLLKKILRELKLASLDESPIWPVEVPMLINVPWTKYFTKTYELYTKAKHGKRKNMLAYSYHLGVLMIACLNNKEEQINPKNKA
ncbi:28401_t:CDS:1, partial [Racocetra persica]